MRKPILTDEEIEWEITRLNTSPEVQLARKEQRVKYKRRQYYQTLKQMEKRGKKLMEQGITMENIETKLFGEEMEM